MREVPVIAGGAKAYPRSENRKMSAKRGSVAVTGASQETCPKDCPLRDRGCYADTHWQFNLVTKPLNDSGETHPLTIIKNEALAIDGLPGNKPMRLHSVGDWPDDDCIAVGTAAVSRYIQRGVDKFKKRPAVWTYTHNHNSRREQWGEVSILESCHTIEQVKDARKRGFAPAFVINGFPLGPKAVPLGTDDNGKQLKGIPCPFEISEGKVHCDECKLCWDDRNLFDKGLVVLFDLHGLIAKLPANAAITTAPLDLVQLTAKG